MSWQCNNIAVCSTIKCHHRYLLSHQRQRFVQGGVQGTSVADVQAHAVHYCVLVRVTAAIDNNISSSATELSGAQSGPGLW